MNIESESFGIFHLRNLLMLTFLFYKAASLKALTSCSTAPQASLEWDPCLFIFYQKIFQQGLAHDNLQQIFVEGSFAFVFCISPGVMVNKFLAPVLSKLNPSEQTSA